MTATRAVRATRARAEKAEADLALATSTRHPVEGHSSGAQAFIATRRNDIGDWAVIDSNAGWRCPDFWDGTAWRELKQSVPQSEVYCWTQQEAHDLAEHYAKVAAETHRHYVSLSRPEFVAWLTGKAEHYIAVGQELASQAVSA